jgi:hypothetical protein
VNETPNKQAREDSRTKLSILQQAIATVVGVSCLLYALLLFENPPSRSIVETKVESAKDATATTTTRTDSTAESTSLALAAFIGGVAFIAYAINGRKITSFPTPFGPVTAPAPEPEDVTVPRKIGGVEIQTAPEAVAGGNPPEDATPRDILNRLLVGLVPHGAIPGQLPSLGPLEGRGPKPGEQITVAPFIFRHPSSAFYFAHDATLCVIALMLDSPIGVIRHTGGCAKHHLDRIGFAGTPFSAQLNSIIGDFDTPRVQTFEGRMQLARELFWLVRMVSNIVGTIEKKTTGQQ